MKQVRFREFRCCPQSSDVPSEEHMVANRMNQLVLRALPRNVFLLESELVQSEIC